MMKVLAVFSVVCALAANVKCQDMTSLMFQALGMDMPAMPPIMPQSLREHLYPGAMEQQRTFQKQMQERKQRYLAYLSAQKQRQMKANPYSAPYTANTQTQPRDNSVYSPANMIRFPGVANSVSSAKANPYSTPYQNSVRKGAVVNPYSTSRLAASSLPAVRNGALVRPAPAQASKLYKTMQTMKVMRDQPRRITDAKAAGCKLPIDSAAASVLMFNDCRNPAARVVCQAELMTCVNVGMAAMCCPYGMNNLAMDTISYVNKLQQYMADMA